MATSHSGASSSHEMPPMLEVHAELNPRPDTRAMPSDRGAKTFSETRAWLLKMYTGAPGTLVGAGLGLLVGYIVTMDAVYPSMRAYDAQNNRKIERFILHPGRLYLRALTCVAIPFAFFNLVLVAAEIASTTTKGVAKLGRRVGFVSLLTSLVVALQGVYIGTMVASKFKGSRYNFRAPALALKCPTPKSSHLFFNTTLQTMVCHAVNQTAFSFGKDVPFTIDPTVNRLVVHSSPIDEIFTVLFGLHSTAFVEATNTNIVTLVMGALVTGVAVGKHLMVKTTRCGVQVIPALREVVSIFEIMTSWVAMTTPFALISLVAGPIYAGTHNVFDPSKPYNGLVGMCWYVLAFVGIALVHTVVVLPLAAFVCSRGRLAPLRFLWHMRAALGHAFQTSSSRKSLSVVLSTYERHAGHVSASTRFAIGAGATLNKNGGALYVSLSVVWLFSNGGLITSFSATKVALLAVIATVGSLAVTPVRNGGMAVVVVAFAMLTGLAPPFAVNFLCIAECVVDPVSTVLNAWGNVLVARLLGDMS